MKCRNHEEDLTGNLTVITKRVTFLENRISSNFNFKFRYRILNETE